jgi:hypothetical protein
LKLLAITVLLPSLLRYLLEVHVVEIVGYGDHLGVPCLPAVGLVTADEQDRGAAWVEGEEDTNVRAERSQLLHVRVTRTFDRVHQRPTEGRTVLLQDVGRLGDFLLVGHGEADPPREELIRVLDLPRHATSIM